MKVTQIEEVSRSRARVYIDEEFAFVLYRGELRSFHIRAGEEMDEEEYRSIMEEVLPKRAKLRAMNLLKTREYTVRQLHDKLKDGGYPERIIEQALDYVESFHYTDDLRYATGFIRNHEGDRSRRRIEQDLMRRGIDRAVLEQAWAAWEEEGGVQEEGAMIRALLEKKGFDRETADQRQKQRMYGFLMRKGFQAEQVRRAVLRDGDCSWE
ncbi:MAG: regulatory protein RecX [Lachnospiraceae bacterium]|jgi:regulatory protein|nr:regulatory protein RecX [Lachnospiraceae bacterium]